MHVMLTYATYHDILLGVMLHGGTCVDMASRNLTCWNIPGSTRSSMENAATMALMAIWAELMPLISGLWTSTCGGIPAGSASD